MQLTHQAIPLNHVVVFFVAAVVAVVTVDVVDCDVPRCDGKNPNFTHSPFCLPTDYNKVRIGKHILDTNAGKQQSKAATDV
jgi:hypothetical protein